MGIDFRRGVTHGSTNCGRELDHAVEFGHYGGQADVADPGSSMTADEHI